MQVEQLQKSLDAHDLGKYFKELKPLIRNSIKLHQSECDEDNIRIGQTKIGGKPDLPQSIDWPTAIYVNEETQETATFPLSFIAQINLSEVTRYDIEKILPKSGVLYFFYDAEQSAWGDEYKDRDKFKVIYWDGNFKELKRTEFPKDLPEDACFTACSVKIKTKISLPSLENEFFNRLTSEERDNYLYGFLADEDFNNESEDELYYYEAMNKLLGYADEIQGEMELDCELAINGLFNDNGFDYDNPRAKTLEPNAKDWRLLLQIDSNDENGMCWGDVGRLYFWIKLEDLLKKDFSKVWVILQCT